MSKKLLDLDGLRYFYGKILARMGNLSNPNLLINEKFQIWDKGEIITDFQPDVPKYTANRWALNTNGSNFKAEKTAKGIKITKISETLTTWAFLVQPLENPPLVGEKVTLTVKVVSGVLGKVRVGVGYGVPSGLSLWEAKVLDTLGKNSITVPVQQNNLLFAINIIDLGLNEFIELEYAKLELGEVATPLSPRPVGEELALCQRYGIGAPLDALLIQLDANNLFFKLILPVNFRGGGISFSNPVFRLFNGNGTELSNAGFTFTPIIIRGNSLLIQATKLNHGITAIEGGMVIESGFIDNEIY